MSSIEICEIIKAGGENGVSSLSFAGLSIMYGAKVATLQDEVATQYLDTLATQSEIDDNVNSNVMEDNDFNLDELAYSDPERYENIMQGDMDA